MPKPTWKGSAGLVEGGVTFTFAGVSRTPGRPQIKNDEAERQAAREAGQQRREPAAPPAVDPEAD